LKNHLGVSLVKPTNHSDDIELFWSFFASQPDVPVVSSFETDVESLIPTALRRTSNFFDASGVPYHSETSVLALRPQSSATGPGAGPQHDPLGSCAMKLNATSEMIPSPGRNSPTSIRFAPHDGWYAELDQQLRDWLCRDHGVCRHQPAAKRRLAGEYAAAGHQGLS
jgi:glycine dehydrogenase